MNLGLGVKDKMEIVPENITNILGCYTHDTYKNDSLKILVSIIHIPFNHWKNILNRYTHDSYKEDAVKILYAQNPSVTIRLDELRSCFNHSQYFISMAKSVGFKDSELEKYKNNDSASITFGPGNLYVGPGASVVMGDSYVRTGLVIDGNTNATELFSKLFPTMSKKAEEIKNKEFPFDKNPVEAKDEEDSKVCNICMVNLKDTLLTPCGHLVCVVCAKQIWDKKQCPDCRGVISDAHKAFI